MATLRALRSHPWKRLVDQTAASLVRGIFVVNNSSASFPCSGKRQFRSEPASSLSSQGLFSIDGLQQPADFLNLATAAIRECDSLRETLRSRNSSGSSPSGVTGVRHATETLFLLDSISRCVCNVIDAAELCRNVHSSERWRDSAGEAFRVLAEYISQLNADRSLYEALDGVYKSPVFADLTEEQRRFAAILRAEFERDGIHLPDDERERLVQLHSHVSGIETLFQQNIQTARNTFEAEYELVTSIIPDEIVFGATGGPDAVPSDPDGMITLETHTHVANTLGRFSSVPDIRRDVYMASNTTCPENLEVLQALRHYRHTIATAQGFESYAERFLTDKMAQNQANVDRFLLDLQERIKKPFRADMEMIADAKRKVERSSDVEPWDIAFYTTLLKARNGFDPSAVAAYLTLDGCLDSMVHLVRHLFGIDMKESPMSVHEQWDVSFAESSSSSSSPSSSSSLRKYSFYDEDGTEVGTMYFDLHARDGKYGHAAHFTVRCGCALDPDSTQFQLPVVAIVCNMSSNIDGKSTCLSHGEVETLFHEFGHALHSLLSRTAFQHMSGTRAAMDFVETPSHLMENFIWDPAFLRILGRHHSTGEQIPEDMIQSLQESRHDFRTIDVQNQILYSRFDQLLFGTNNNGTNGMVGPSSSMTDQFRKLFIENGVPYADGTHWFSRFGHLVTYGAGYYGYLYSQILAADVWQAVFQGQSLEREAGHRWRREVLVHGGSKDPNEMLNNALGRKPSSAAFFAGLDE